jgi:hypothetical protein
MAIWIADSASSTGLYKLISKPSPDSQFAEWFRYVAMIRSLNQAPGIRDG